MHNVRNTLVALLVACASPALAHEDHAHAGQHGGTVVKSGHHRLEVVARDGELEVHLDGEGGHAEDIQSAQATAIVLSQGKKEEITLTPDPGNVLKGSGSFKAVKGATIVITLTMPGHEPEQARVTLD